MITSTITPARVIREVALGMTQGELAELCGISQPMVSKWEKSSTGIPDKYRDTIKNKAKQRGYELEDIDFKKVRMSLLRKRKG